MIKIWCKTQAIVALSSAEAELYGIVRASAETLGMMAMYMDMGEKVEGTVLGDVSAALAIIHRKGLGKFRHLDTNYLWEQEAAARKQIAYKKVHGKENVADLFTKPVSWEEICKHVEEMRGEFSLEWLGVNPDKETENSILELA